MESNFETCERTSESRAAGGRRVRPWDRRRDRRCRGRRSLPCGKRPGAVSQARQRRRAEQTEWGTIKTGLIRWVLLWFDVWWFGGFVVLDVGVLKGGGSPAGNAR